MLSVNHVLDRFERISGSTTSGRRAFGVGRVITVAFRTVGSGNGGRPQAMSYEVSICPIWDRSNENMQLGDFPGKVGRKAAGPDVQGGSRFCVKSRTKMISSTYERVVIRSAAGCHNR